MWVISTSPRNEEISTGDIQGGKAPRCVGLLRTRGGDMGLDVEALGLEGVGDGGAGGGVGAVDLHNRGEGAAQTGHLLALDVALTGLHGLGDLSEDSGLVNTRHGENDGA